MGVGGLRWCFVSLAASLPMVAHVAHAEPARPGVADAPQALPPAPPGVVPAPPPASPEAPTLHAPVRWTMPPDAARRYSPFFNGTLGGLWVGKRFDSSSTLGTELGAFFGRWRLSLRASFPFGVYQQTGVTLSNSDFQSIASTKPALVWSGGVGFALYSGYGFVASSSLNYMRSDVSDFGNMLGVALPLEWVTQRGIRIGLEAGFLRAFGGEVLGKCKAPDPFGPSPAPRECDQGEIRAFDRAADNGGWLQFLLGIPFEAPEPEPVHPGASE